MIDLLKIAAIVAITLLVHTLDYQWGVESGDINPEPIYTEVDR